MCNGFLTQVSEDLNGQFKTYLTTQAAKQSLSDVVSIKILNQGAWARSYERQPVSLPRELEDFIPEVEEFYKSKHSGRKLQWHHHMSNGTITFANSVGKFDLEVTTHQMAVLFCWENRRYVQRINSTLAFVLSIVLWQTRSPDDGESEAGNRAPRL